MPALSAPPPALRAPRTAARPSAGRGLRGGQRASEPASAAAAPGQDPAARMTARGAAGRCPRTVSGGRGAGSGGDRSSATGAALRTGRQGAPAAATGYGCHPMLARGGSRALGLRPAAALQLFLRLDCTEGFTEPPAGKREGFGAAGSGSRSARGPLPLPLGPATSKEQAEWQCAERGAFPGGHPPHPPHTCFQALVGSGR